MTEIGSAAPAEIPQTAPEIALRYSNFNLPARIAFAGGVTAHERTLAAIERADGGRPGTLYTGGFDITPTRRLLLDPCLPELADSVHQTWPQTPLIGLREQPTVRSKLMNAFFWLTMPESRASLRTLRRFSDRPQTVYGHQRDTYGDLVDFSGLGDDVATQISPESLAELGGLEEFSAYHLSLWQRGVSGLIVDDAHLTRAADKDLGFRLQNPNGVLVAIEEAGAWVAGIHVAAGRVDLKLKDDRDTSMGNLDLILTGPEAMHNSPMGERLARAFKIARRQRRNSVFLSESRHEATLTATLEIERLRASLSGDMPEEERQKIESEVVALQEVAVQYQSELAYRQLQNANGPRPVPVTQEIPHRGLVAANGGKLTWRAFLKTSNAIGRTITTFFTQVAAGETAD